MLSTIRWIQLFWDVRSSLTCLSSCFRASAVSLTARTWQGAFSGRASEAVVSMVNAVGKRSSSLWNWLPTPKTRLCLDQFNGSPVVKVAIRYRSLISRLRSVDMIVKALGNLLAGCEDNWDSGRTTNLDLVGFASYRYRAVSIAWSTNNTQSIAERVRLQKSTRGVDS